MTMTPQTPQRSPNDLLAASEVLTVLSCLIRAIQNGGQASELHLQTLRGEVIVLLKELGGFDEVMCDH